MGAASEQGRVREHEKSIPVAFDVDVAVAGAGIAGVLTAIASARKGARTVLIDRFGSVGGNAGPGMITGGSLFGEADYTLPGGVAGITREVQDRLEALLGGLPRTYASISTMFSYLAQTMLREAGVEMILSAYASDPLMERERVGGLFVETKSGRLAVRAKVTVDATGDASLAARAGAPIIRSTEPRPSFDPIIRPSYMDARFPAYNETTLLAVVAGVDPAEYEKAMSRSVEPTEDDRRWAAEHQASGCPAFLVPALRQEWEAGTFQAVRKALPNAFTLVKQWKFEEGGSGLYYAKVAARGDIHADDWRHVSVLEAAVREQAIEFVRFLNRHVPGCQAAYVLFTAPFLGTRGGPCIDGEHTLTPEECIAGARFDDVIFVNVHEGTHGGAKEGFDIPYGMLLPKKIDGMLVTGRGAAYLRRGHDPTGVRARPSMMVLGHATGIAAALAAQEGRTAKTVDIKGLQRALLREGLYLGEADKLSALGLL